VVGNLAMIRFSSVIHVKRNLANSVESSAGLLTGN
jgi:hypothetical protein